MGDPAIMGMDHADGGCGAWLSRGGDTPALTPGAFQQNVCARTDSCGDREVADVGISGTCGTTDGATGGGDRAASCGGRKEGDGDHRSGEAGDMTDAVPVLADSGGERVLLSVRRKKITGPFAVGGRTMGTIVGMPDEVIGGRHPACTHEGWIDGGRGVVFEDWTWLLSASVLMKT